jgi:hypothetical protein
MSMPQALSFAFFLDIDGQQHAGDAAPQVAQKSDHRSADIRHVV